MPEGNPPRTPPRAPSHAPRQAYWLRHLVSPSATWWLPARRVLLFYAAVLLLALLWRALALGDLPWAAPDSTLRPLWQRALAGLALGLAIAYPTRLWVARTALGARLGGALGGVLRGLRRRETFVLALLSGVAEELLFRGAMQPHLSLLLESPALGLLLTSLLFGALHSFPERGAAAWWRSIGFVWSASAFLISLALGALFVWSGDALAPIIAHTTLNALNIHWLAQRAQGENTPAP